MVWYGIFLTLIFFHSHCIFHFSSIDCTSSRWIPYIGSKFLQNIVRIYQTTCHHNTFNHNFSTEWAPSQQLKRAYHFSLCWLWKSLIPKMAQSKGMSWADFPMPMVLNGMLCSLPAMPCERVLSHPPSLPWKCSLLLFLLWPAKGFTVTFPSLAC